VEAWQEPEHMPMGYLALTGLYAKRAGTPWPFAGNLPIDKANECDLLVT
jgi:hypothetical protein